MWERRYKRLSKVVNLHPFSEDVLGLFYPKCCVECGRQLLPNAEVLCHICTSELPRCFFSDRAGNRLEELFYGRVRIEAATSYLYFKKHGLVQNLLHSLKYRGRQDIGAWIGSRLSKEISASSRFDSIDLVVPVPLHPKKKKIRGYNQVVRFAKALAGELHVPLLEDVLERTHRVESLTGKSRIDRIGSMKETFALSNIKSVRGQHVLLVDDVITSGATLETCAHKLLDLPGTRVSLASMAFTL